MLRGEGGEAVRESLCLYVYRATVRSLSGAPRSLHVLFSVKECVSIIENAGKNSACVCHVLFPLPPKCWAVCV